MIKKLLNYLTANIAPVMIADANLNVYEDQQIVESYKSSHYLTAAESSIINTFKDFFAGKILDIGIGAGRTTFYFAPLAQSYSGMDFSGRMIDFCKKEFAAQTNVSFCQDDARTLSQYETGAFDTAFFSFNGIDCVDYEGRASVLQQVHRVLKSNGHFIFSFHNTGYLDKLYSYHWAKNPMYWFWNLQRMQKVKAVNGPKSNFSGKDFFILKDGGENFQLNILYISPELQEQDLESAGYKVLKRIENATGKGLSREEANRSKAASIYFVCEKI